MLSKQQQADIGTYEILFLNVKISSKKTC